MEIWYKTEKIWTTSTDDDYISSLILDNDGKINLLGKDNSIRWKSETLPTNWKAYLMQIQNDGNLVVDNECGKILWYSKTGRKIDNVPGIYLIMQM